MWLVGLGIVAALLLRVDTETIQPFGNRTTCGEARSEEPLLFVDRERLLKACIGHPDMAQPLARPASYEVTRWSIPLTEWIALTAGTWGITIITISIAAIWRRGP